MHSLTIVFGPVATTWVLMFKERDKADEAFATADAAKELFRLTDDFGQYVQLRSDQLHGMMLEDLDLSQDAFIERGLHNARSQAKAQEKAMTDPKLMAMMRRQGQGPAVLQPGGMGMPNGRMS